MIPWGSLWGAIGVPLGCHSGAAQRACTKSLYIHVLLQTGLPAVYRAVCHLHRMLHIITWSQQGQLPSGYGATASQGIPRGRCPSGSAATVVAWVSLLLRYSNRAGPYCRSSQHLSTPEPFRYGDTAEPVRASEPHNAVKGPRGCKGPHRGICSSMGTHQVSLPARWKPAVSVGSITLVGVS